MFDELKATKHLEKLLKFYNIKVIGNFKSSAGRAWIKRREIKIPKPTNVENFCVCMHEIRHITYGSKGRSFEQEYECEMFAISEAKKLGFNTSDYEIRAKGYVTMCINKAYRRKLDLDTIPQNIKQWCDVDFDMWKDKTVWIDRSVKPIKIAYE